MVSFAAVPLPACEPDPHRATIAAAIEDWITSAPVRALVSRFGAALPDAGPDELLTWLDAFSAEHWDFRRRGNAERDQVEAPAFDQATTALITEAATALHLVAADPPARRSYEHVLILGGLGRACLQRTEFAARLIRDGTVTTPAVAALGSFRPLTAAETTLPALTGHGHEADAMDAGVRAGFGYGETAEKESSPGPVTHRSWQVRTYRAPGLPTGQVLAAPSSDPGRRRANTADTYEFWARRADLGPADRILVVTSPIYVPFQHSDAIRMIALRYGCGIDTIGFDPARTTIPLAPDALAPERYLQEIRSALLSLRHLHLAVRQDPRSHNGSRADDRSGAGARSDGGSPGAPR
ncbi:hypothetical protein [Actinoplanes sp. NPDC051494]|uniref:hypothetical protein n=1 Tax=Actinoplanes sp. NPDC051494 TaxID=3363907 RepID=UPI0037969FB7